MKEQFIVVREKRIESAGTTEFHIAQIEALQRELEKTKAKVLELESITRLEVISGNGRLYVNRDTTISELSVQDEGRTLKIFINL